MMFGQIGSNSPTEPMLLGSPQSSPGSPISGSGSQFLPGYLTGSTTPCTPPVTTKMWGVGSSPAVSSFPQYVTNIHGNEGSSPYSKTPRNVPEQRRRDKPGVPPVEGLFDKMSSPVISSPFQSTTVQDRLSMTETVFSSTSLTDHAGILTPNKSLNRLPDTSYISPAQVDPFYTQRESLTATSQLDDTWVTIFGFPPTATSYILQQFSHCGTILEHKVATKGNWMHIHYETKLQAKKAIGKNGKIFADSIMVGVTQCIDKNVMTMAEFSKENSVLSPNLSTSFGSSGTTSRGLRPLTQAYKTAVATHKVTPQSRTPQKNNTVVSKAMEYLLNW